ncbi:MAG: DUF2809 domain-containing protein [Oscillospiraceae bacterium]|nr:DUF2809 domain-containing protein [Oscillospiraceae bacterium]
MQPRKTAICYGIAALALFLIEFVIGKWLNDWHFVRAYMGDVLVIPLLYCLVRIFTNKLPRTMPLVIFGIGVVTEITQYFKLYAILGFERNSLPAILLGTSFSWYDLICYAAGTVLIYLAEWLIFTAIGKRNETA